jgi:hypothetical protein
MVNCGKENRLIEISGVVLIEGYCSIKILAMQLCFIAKSLEKKG